LVFILPQTRSRKNLFGKNLTVLIPNIVRFRIVDGNEVLSVGPQEADGRTQAGVNRVQPVSTAHTLHRRTQ
jgi:hypothetical protein